jgi:hypothetical protein
VAQLLSKEFSKFHETIKLKRYDENATLRDKRDKILKALRDGLTKHFASSEEAKPTFDWFNQGSYAMNTGIKPLGDGDYDIDVGIRFHVSINGTYSDPTTLKALVRDVLQDHGGVPTIKRPCVTVDYPNDDYHVDLAIYASAESNNNQNHLAKGYEGSSVDNKTWEPSDAEAFIKLVDERHDGPNGQQFRRIIRYLKRWKDHRFRSDGNEAPVGIGLTLNVYHAFVPDFDSRDGSPRDLLALLKVVRLMLADFATAPHEENGEIKKGRRLKASIPVKPWDDVYDRMSNKQMEKFENRLKELREALETAYGEIDPFDAAKILQKQFGDDFPIPDPESNARKTSKPAITTSSSSA